MSGTIIWSSEDRTRPRRRAISCVWTNTDNHSADLLAVHHGSITPTYICGYHEQSRGIPQGEHRHLIAEQQA